MVEELMNAKEQEDDPRKWDPWKKVKIQKKQRKIFCIPVNIVLCSLFLKAFVFHILRVFVFPAFLLLWFFALQKKPKLSSRSTKQIRVDITTTTTSATLERSITCDLGNVTQKRVYSVSMTHPDFLLSRLLDNNCDIVSLRVTIL